MELSCLKELEKEYFAQYRHIFRSELRNKVGLSMFALMTGSTRQLLLSGTLLTRGRDTKGVATARLNPTRLFQEDLRQSRPGLASSNWQQEPRTPRLRSHKKGMLSNICP